MSNHNKISVAGVKGFYPNTTFQFVEQGVIIKISLPIERRMVKFIPRENIKQGESGFYYFLRLGICSSRVNDTTVQATHDKLLNIVMQRCRQAKRMALQSEIKQLKLEI